VQLGLMRRALQQVMVATVSLIALLVQALLTVVVVEVRKVQPLLWVLVGVGAVAMVREVLMLGTVLMVSVAVAGVVLTRLTMLRLTAATAATVL
jgi:hypothetical protein